MKGAKANFEILVAALGQEAYPGQIIGVNRQDYTSQELVYNLGHYWAWNIRSGMAQVDGLTTFIRWA